MAAGRRARNIRIRWVRARVLSAGQLLFEDSRDLLLYNTSDLLLYDTGDLLSHCSPNSGTLIHTVDCSFSFPAETLINYRTAYLGQPEIVVRVCPIRSGNILANLSCRSQNSKVFPKWRLEMRYHLHPILGVA